MKRYVRVGMVGSFIAVAMTLTAVVSTASAQFTQVLQGGAQCSEEGPGCGCNPEQIRDEITHARNLATPAGAHRRASMAARILACS